jgi:hypothetical protein
MGAQLTVDELVATLRHSTLPAILVEGVNDLAVWRHLEALLDPTRVTVLSCGGRGPLLEVFERRDEFPTLKVVCVADRDLWVFQGVPREYDQVLVTEGYSIENDAYTMNLEQLLTERERASHSAVLNAVCEWFAFAIKRTMDGDSEVDLSHHPTAICKDPTVGIDRDFAARIQYVPAPNDLMQDIRMNYRVKLRGKQLLEALVRFLSASDRNAKHSKRALLEMSFKLFQPPPIQRLLNEISRALDLPN